jgi:hypothetical protein
MVFTYCDSGQVGSIHDALMFRRSDLYTGILDGTIAIPPDTHIIGDSAYPLSQSLIVPYRQHANITPGERRFNIRLSKARQVIERAFALLKGRFGRLFYLSYMQSIENIPMVIIASCILHNICIFEGDWEWVPFNEAAEAVANPVAPINDNLEKVCDGLNREQGIIKRDAIKQAMDT